MSCEKMKNVVFLITDAKISVFTEYNKILDLFVQWARISVLRKHRTFERFFFLGKYKNFFFLFIY